MNFGLCNWFFSTDEPWIGPKGIKKPLEYKKSSLCPLLQSAVFCSRTRYIEDDEGKGKVPFLYSLNVNNIK